MYIYIYMDLDREIRVRAGAARQAFSQIRQPIFANRALPLQARLALFQSLVLSRLLYGCAIWAEISSISLRHVEAMMTGCCRQILGVGFWNDSHLDDAQVYQQHQPVPFRVFLAKHRLCHLQSVARSGITAHKTLLLAELELGKGWLHELGEDLRWMSTLIALPFELPSNRTTWLSTWAALRSISSWKTWTSRAIRKHVTQELIAHEVKYYHNSIRSELES